VADVIAAWGKRYLEQPETMTEAEVEVGTVLVRGRTTANTAGDIDRAAPFVGRRADQAADSTRSGSL
jgi:hypothetical protein